MPQGDLAGAGVEATREEAGGGILRTKSLILIMLQTLLFGEMSITKSSCFGQSGVPETQSQRKYRLRNPSQRC